MLRGFEMDCSIRFTMPISPKTALMVLKSLISQLKKHSTTVDKYIKEPKPVRNNHIPALFVLINVTWTGRLKDLCIVMWRITELFDNF